MARVHGRNEWLSENAYRAFPFEEDSPSTATDGFRLPTWLVRDFRCTMLPWLRGDPGDTGVLLAGFEISLPYRGRMDVALYLHVPSMAGQIVNSSLPEFADDPVFTVSAGIPLDGAGTVAVARKMGYPWMTSAHNLASALNARCVLGAPAALPPDDDLAVRVPGGWVTRHFFVGSVDESMNLVPESVERDSNGVMAPVPSEPRILPTRVVCIPGGTGIGELELRPPDGMHAVDGTDVIGYAHVGDGRDTELRIYNGELHLVAYAGGGTASICDCEDAGEPGFVKYLNGQCAGTDGDFRIVGGEGIEIGEATYAGIPGVSVRTGSAVNEFAKPAGDR